MTLATGECLKTILFPRRKGRARGQTTVEFALICLPFFAILFGIIDFAQIYFYENSVQNALREAARFATAGRIIQSTNSSGAPEFITNSSGVVVPKAINDSSGREASRNECIRYWFLSNCVLGNFPLSNIVITSAPTLPGVPPVLTTNGADVILASGYTVTTNSSTSAVSTNPAPAVTGPGGATDYVQITATYKVSTITPLMSFMGGYSRQGWNVYPVRASAIIKNEPAFLNFQHLAIYPGEP